VRSFEQQTADAIRNLVIVCVILAVALVVAIALASWGLGRAIIANDAVGAAAQDSCVIQARGLPAGHELAAALSNLHSLLIVPETAAQKRAQRSETPLQRYLTDQLNGHLAKYQAAEASQPHSRSC
jgi:hypothetical protein